MPTTALWGLKWETQAPRGGQGAGRDSQANFPLPALAKGHGAPCPGREPQGSLVPSSVLGSLVPCLLWSLC